MKKIILLFLLISATVFSQEKLDKLLNIYNEKNIPYISVQELAMPKTKAILLDAREKNEFDVSHIKNAHFVGFKNFDLEKTMRLFPNKQEKIIVYCSLGVRSEKVASKLKEQGYKNIYNLYGGIFEWKNSGFTVVDSEGKPTEKVHAYNKNWGKWLKKGKKSYE